MNNELTTLPNLAAYNAPADLVEVRRNEVKFPRIKSTPSDEAVKKMVPLVYGAALYRGQEIDEQRLYFTANALVAEIMADRRYGLKELSWLEIGLAFRSSVLGEGREMYGVNVASLYASLIEYVKTIGHEADKRARQ